MDGELLWVQILLAFELSSLVNVGELLKLLLDPSELDSPLLSSCHEDLLGVWEGAHQVKQDLLLQTVGVSGVVHA